MSSSDSNWALHLEGVTKSFGRKRALAGIEMKVPRGAICGLVGPNGAGKTTTFGIVCGFLRPDAGAVDVLGFGPFNPAKHRGRVTGLPQDSSLGRDLRVAEQLEYFARLQGLSAKEATTDVERILDVVDLRDRAGDRIRTLSHGMLRRLGIGQAFIGTPELVLLDEPTNGVDPRRSHEIRAFIESQRGARTIVVSSHNLNEIEAMCDHVVLIDHGSVVMSGRVSEITGRDCEILIELGEGPCPEEELCAALLEADVNWQPDSRRFTIRFASSPERQAEDVIGSALRVLLDKGARISSVSRGRTLEKTYLAST